MKFEMANRLALSLPRGAAEAQYKLFLHILIRSLNIEGLQRMADMTEVLYGVPKYSKKQPVSAAEWREWAGPRAQKWNKTKAATGERSGMVGDHPRPAPRSPQPSSAKLHTEIFQGKGKQHEN